MFKVSEKIGRAALYFLVLAGPILGFATKGFAPLLTISGGMAFIAVLLRSANLKQLELRKFIFAAPFLLFIGFSLLWSESERSGSSYFVLILVVVFTACLRITFKELSIGEQDKFKHLLSISLLFGIIVSISIGSYPLFWPELSSLANIVSNQISFANIELVRQSNRSLSLIPVFLFPLAGFYWHRARWLFVPLFVVTFFITANSNSQTAFLALLLGTLVFGLSYLNLYDGRKLIFTVMAIGLLASPIMFVKSYENNFVQNYAPPIIKQKASGELRQWMYYAYAKEALSQPILGHGFRSTENFSPKNHSNYKDPVHERNLTDPFAHAHNFPLQIIFEFGYLGAILFLAAFWWLLNLRFDNPRRATHAATLGATCGLLLFAYSLWQTWLLASLGFLYFYMSILYRRDGLS